MEKEVRLQNGVRGEPALVSPSSFFLPHLSPAQPWYCTILWSLQNVRSIC